MCAFCIRSGGAGVSKEDTGGGDPVGRTMEWLKTAAVLLAVGLWCDGTARAEPKFGAQGGEGPPYRRQEWLVPTQDPVMPSRALLFRPPGKGPFRIAVIAHASTQNRLARAQMPLPDYPALTAALVARGFAVLVPQRLGHGRTGGPYLEDQEGCDSAEYGLAARATADSIAAALAYVRAQPFARRDASVIVGHSAGGLGALALAADRPAGFAGIVVFAPGRGGRKDGRAGAVCAPEKLIAAVGELGEGARVPVTWLVAENDSYFPPEMSRRMAEAFRAAGGAVDFRVLPPFGDEGHWFAEAADAAALDALLGGAKGVALQQSARPVAGNK
jgi:dienelactone hydrolase